MKQMLGNFAKLKLELFFWGVFLAHGWLAITTITLVLNKTNVFWLQMWGKYKQKDLVGRQLSVSLYSRFHYELFWMEMDTSKNPY